MADLIYWLWLTTRKGLGAAGALTVLDHFSTPERAYYGEREDFEALSLPPFVKQSLLDKSLDEPNRILGDCDRLSMQVMTFQDANYPQRLRQIEVPPVVLYIRGKMIRFDEEAAIGIVGMRDCTARSCQRAERFAMDLSAKGALVVSGIAEGVDSSAVTGALKAGKPVVSMLAGGADRVFPKESWGLYQDVAAVGALISEYPPGTPHKGDHFRLRNRILSGLCLGVLAVECRTQGGTMLTVNHALEQGREVYAIPAGLDEQCAKGTNRLIHDQKARLVECAEDILKDYYNWFPTKLIGGRTPPPERVSERRDKPQSIPPPPAPEPEPGREVLSREDQASRFTDDQCAILAAVAREALTADEIVERTQVPMKRALSAITMLQLDGVLEERPGRRFYALVELA